MVTRHIINKDDGTSAEYEIPEFALESTSTKIEKHLGNMSRDQQMLMRKLLNEIVKGTAEAEKTTKAVTESNEALIKAFKEDFGTKFIGDMESTFRRAGDVITGLTKAVAGTTLLMGGTLYASVMKLGSSITSLTDKGLAFGDGVGNAASDTIRQFNKLGLSTDEATTLMKNYSRMFAIGDQARITGIFKTFLEGSKNGVEFGKTIKETTDYLAEELMARTRLIQLENINYEKLNTHMTTTATNLLKFSTVLGVSQEAMQAETQNTLDSHKLWKNYLALQKDGGKMLNQSENIILALQGTLGPFAGEVSDALLTVAATGNTVRSDVINELRVVNPLAAEELTGVAMRLRAGKIDPDAIGKELTPFFNAMKNLTEAELKQIHAILTANGELVDVAGKQVDLIARLSGFVAEEIDGMVAELSEVQRVDLEIKNAKAKLLGAYNDFINVLALKAAGPLLAVTTSLTEAMKDGGPLSNAFKDARDNIANDFDEVFGGTDGFTRWLVEIVDGAGENFIVFVKEAGEAIGRFIAGFKIKEGDNKGEISIIQGFQPLLDTLSEAIKKGIVDGFKVVFGSSSALKLIGIIIGGLSGISLLTTLGKKALTGAGSLLKKGGKKALTGAGSLLKKGGKGALTGAGSLLKKGGKKTLTGGVSLLKSVSTKIKNSGIGSALKSVSTKIKNSGIGSALKSVSNTIKAAVTRRGIMTIMSRLAVAALALVSWPVAAIIAAVLLALGIGHYTGANDWVIEKIKGQFNPQPTDQETAWERNLGQETFDAVAARVEAMNSSETQNTTRTAPLNRSEEDFITQFIEGSAARLPQPMVQTQTSAPLTKSQEDFITQFIEGSAARLSQPMVQTQTSALNQTSEVTESQLQSEKVAQPPATENHEVSTLTNVDNKLSMLIRAVNNQTDMMVTTLG